MINLKEMEPLIFDALSDAFENMAFMEVNRTENVLTEAELAKYICSSLTFNATFEGVILLYLTYDLLAQIAEDLYSLDASEITEQVEHDILGEINNTFVGEYLSKIVPENETFTMGLPEVKKNDFSQDDDGKIILHYLVEEWQIRVELIETVQKN